MMNELKRSQINKEAHDFLVKLDYPFSNDEELNPTIVFLRTPNDFKSIIENISKEFLVDSDHFQAGDQFLVAFVNNQNEINKTITRYAHRISENGKFWFVTNQHYLLDDENNFLTLINSQFKSTQPLIQLRNNYYAKLFQLKDNITNIANVEHYRTRKREAMRQNMNDEKQNSIRLSSRTEKNILKYFANNDQSLKTNLIENELKHIPKGSNNLNLIQPKHNLTNILIKKKS
ncbi:unnamed protein product [Rotaria sp. Silwood1]|nr:unnamed protein product [Rotaria sp. Silwood1]CAF1221848.1 unnamed protein product [Rotaria sp. Silwood1]